MDDDEQFLRDIELAKSLSLAESKASMAPASSKGWSEAEKAFFTDEPIALRNPLADKKEMSKPTAKSSSSMGTIAMKPVASVPVCAKCGKPCHGSHLKRIGDQCFHPECLVCAKCRKEINGSAVLRGSPGSLAMYHRECVQGHQFLCPTCHQECGQGRHVIHNGDHYHPHCFRCAGCHQPIDSVFSLKGEPPQPYHANCAKELFNPRCVVCGKILDGRYLQHPFFPEEMYCESHRLDNQCFSCGRKARKATPLVDLLDGRSLCSICSETIVMDSTEAGIVFQEVIAFLQGHLNLPIPPALLEVPILAVDLFSLNENLSSSLNGHCNGTGASTGAECVVRGCTLSVQRTVRHLSGPSSVQYARGVGLLAFHPSTFTTQSIREVTAILVLYGMPRDLMGSVIAHEAMHAFVKLTPGNFPHDLPRDVEEGMCQLIAFEYLEHLSSIGSAAGHRERETNVAERQRQYFRHQIAQDPSESYGESFRKLRKAVDQLGLHVVLEYIGHSRSFPAV